MMDSLLRSIVQFIKETDDVEMLLLKWGRVFLFDAAINFDAAKNTWIEEILSLFSQQEVSYHDVAELDLLSVMSDLRSLDWHSFKLQFKDNDRNYAFELSDFQSRFRRSLLKVGYYDIVVKRSDDLATWVRVSKPNNVSAAYLLYFSESQSLLCAGCRNLRTVLVEVVKTCLGAASAVPDNSFVKSYKVTAAPTIIKPASYSSTKRKSARYSRKRHPRQFSKYRLVHHVVPQAIRHSVVETSSCLRARGEDQFPPIWVRGRLELFGPDVMKGLYELSSNNLADLPPHSLTKALFN